MKQILVVLACAATLMVSGCGGESSLPKATGKANLRAINAIPTSPEISFLIEERSLGAAGYQDGTTPAPFDDLNYTFNFEAFYPGETSFRRFASKNVDVVANKDYVFLIGGSLASPTITIWQSDVRTFDAADTVFAANFAHASASLGALDYYFADAAVAPVPGNQVATLSFGEASDAADYAEGDYVLTITAAGDPNDVVFTSDSGTYGARDTYLFASFDGDAGDTAPVFVRAFSAAGANIAVPDANFPPTVQFINASMDLGASDIYDDEMLASLRVADHDFLSVSAELEITPGAVTFFYTPAGDTSVVSLETAFSAFGGTRYRIVAFGAAGGLAAAASIPNLRPVETHVKILPFQASNNFPFIDLYLVAPDALIDDLAPIRRALASGEVTVSGALLAGTYDVYVTETDEKVVLAGPYRITVAIGDVVDLLIVDTVDPAVLDVLFLSGGPTP